MLPPARIRTAVSLPLSLGDGELVDAVAYTFHDLVDGGQHLLLGLGEFQVARPLVRPHSECLTGDVLASARCDCGPQLREALRRISVVGGFLLYLRQEGRGIGLYNKLDAYALQDQGQDTFQANRSLGFPEDDRDYRVVAQMMAAMGVERVELLTNNPDKVAQIRAAGLIVEAVHSTELHLRPENADYLAAKAQLAGHSLPIPARPV
ncbi:MAG: cyclohydrolase [Nocardioidaceae bacterium]|nr:cyclohydrolase [Nocardioidaceae bacterium]